MRIAFQDHVDAINAHLDLFPDRGEFEDFHNDHKTELKAKDNKNTINYHIIKPIIALAERVHKMAITQ